MLEEISTFAAMIIKSPMRFVCKSKKDHDWRWYGGGFLFSNKYAFRCARCGCRSTSKFEDLEKKGFKGKMRMR